MCYMLLTVGSHPLMMIIYAYQKIINQIFDCLYFFNKDKTLLEENPFLAKYP